MEPTSDERLAHVEGTLRRLTLRVERLERDIARTTAAKPEAAREPAPAAPPEPVVWERTVPAAQIVPRPRREGEPVPAAPLRRREAPPPKPEMALEDLLGGRILAWVGGLAVVLAATFFVVTAVRRGWIDVPTRIGLAFLGSTLLVAIGAWLHEKKGQTQASRALVASGIASLYLTVVAATQVYHLIEAGLAFAIAGLVALVSTVIAVRWDSKVVAGLGIGGALLSPVLVGAGTSSSSLAFMGIATTASVGVLVWRSWTWLGVMTFALTAPQLGAWIADEYESRLGLTLGVLALFWALYLAAAAGFELRVPSAHLRFGAGLLTAADAVLVAAVGWAVLDDSGHPDAATAWVLGFAAIHVAIGLSSRLSARINPDFGTIAITLGLVYSAVGLALALDGAALVAAWAVEAIALAAVARARLDWRVAVAALGFLAIAAAHTLAFDAPPAGLAGAAYDPSQALLAIAFTLAASIALAVLLPRSGPAGVRLEDLPESLSLPEQFDLRLPLGALALGSFMYLLGYAFDGTTLVLALSLTAAGIAAGAIVLDDKILPAAIAPLGVAAAHVLAFEAPPRGLFLGVTDLGDAVIGITCVVAAAATVGALARDVELRRGLLGSAGAGAVYLASIAIVDQWGVNAAGERLQGGQLAMSALWAAVGVGLVVAGLVRDLAWLRRGGLALLGVAVVKVFTYDLAELTDLARVASLLVIGLVLIAAAYFYQRLRAGHEGPIRWRHP